MRLKIRRPQRVQYFFAIRSGHARIRDNGHGLSHTELA
jgi:hypothetical protein